MWIHWNRHSQAASSSSTSNPVRSARLSRPRLQRTRFHADRHVLLRRYLPNTAQFLHHAPTRFRPLRQLASRLGGAMKPWSRKAGLLLLSTLTAVAAVDIVLVRSTEPFA